MNILTNKQLQLTILTLFFTIVCGLQWSSMNSVSIFVVWLSQAYYIYIALSAREKNYLERKDKTLLNVYFLWVSFNIIRGALFYTNGNYWIWKNLFQGSFAVLLPSLIYLYSFPNLLKIILRYWMKYALVIFLLLLSFLSRGAYHFYLGPVYIAGCFWPIYPKKWKIILILLLLSMIFVDFGARSQVIKTGVVVLVSLGYMFRHMISYKLMKIAHWLMYALPILLLVLGITGFFNIFEDLSSKEGKYVQIKKDEKGNVVREDFSADTRTFIFVEVIESAIKNNYVIWGRTPARGNDSLAFGTYNAEDLKTGLYERHSNETGLPSFFTWLGLVGLIMLSLIYLRSSYLAVYRSNNIYLKFIGCFVAFRWAYGWIEDMYSFSPMIISLMMMMGMCLSRKFREMNNTEMRKWLLSLVK